MCVHTGGWGTSRYMWVTPSPHVRDPESSRGMARGVQLHVPRAGLHAGTCEPLPLLPHRAWFGNFGPRARLYHGRVETQARLVRGRPGRGLRTDPWWPTWPRQEARPRGDATQPRSSLDCGRVGIRERPAPSRATSVRGGNGRGEGQWLCDPGGQGPSPPGGLRAGAAP